MEPKDLTRLFEINAYVVKENTKELTHEDSLILPHPGGNCLNWVMGHIVASRNLILNLVGKQPIWSEEETKPYTRGSEPLAKGDDARQFNSILADFAKSQEQIMSALSNLTSPKPRTKKKRSVKNCPSCIFTRLTISVKLDSCAVWQEKRE